MYLIFSHFLIYTLKGNWKYFYKGEKMQAVTAIFYNKIFVSSATGWLVVQVKKTIIHLFFLPNSLSQRD